MLSHKKLTLTGALILVLLAAPLAVVYADVGLVSDDFHAGFNTSLWVADPLDEYVHEPSFFSKQTSGADSYLQIAVPAGVKRSLSASATSLQAPRVMQEVVDDGMTPFTITVKFLGVPSFSDGSYAAMQGIVVKGIYDPDLNPNTTNYPSYWRFGIDSGSVPGQVDLYSMWFYQTGEDTFGDFGDIFPSPGFARSADSPIWLRVVRTVEQDPETPTDYWSTFDYSYSTNGTTWTSLTPRSQEGTGPLNQIRQTFVVTHIGVFAGTTGDNPAYTAKIDWVSVTSDAPPNEDEGTQPTTYTLSYNANPTGGTITGTAAGEYDEGQSVSLTAVADSGYTFQNWTVNGTPQSSNPLNFTLDEDTTVVAIFEPEGVQYSDWIYLPMVIR